MEHLDSVELITTKGPKSLAGVKYLQDKGIDTMAIKEKTVVFSGSARDAVRFFPKNVNVAATVSLARELLARGWASTLQCTMTIPYPGTPLFKELSASGGLTTLDWDCYDMRTQIMKTPLAPEGRIKAAVREVYRGFLQPRALARRLFSTKTLFDFGFYWRGVRSLAGHLSDFGRK